MDGHKHENIMNTPTKYDDIIDSRDIISRIEELTEERDDLDINIQELEEQIDDVGDVDPEDADATSALDDLRIQLDDARKALTEWHNDNGAEFQALLDLAEEAEYSPDWRHGETLIRRSYFQDYAQELADDCGMLENANQWPLRCIDWEQAARELEMDYMSVDFDGVEYLIRA